jgi:hypothetical protein
MASELSMNGRKKIETLQKEFTQKFPYLTLVFLDKERRAIDISKSLSEVRQAKGADISIIASLKVNTLEKRFLENFGLVVEVAYQKSDKVVYTKDNVDKTLNELNKWCQENGCQPFEFKKSFTGNTLSSVQEQLFEAIKEYYPNAEAKKINKDNYLDIYIPEIHNKRGTHLFFNTAKDGIKVGLYCRDEDFVEEVLSNSSNIEKFGQGIRILNNPLQNDVEAATASALSFIEEITGEQNEIKQAEIDIDASLNEKAYEVGEEEEEYDDIEEEDIEEEEDDFEEEEEEEEEEDDYDFDEEDDEEEDDDFEEEDEEYDFEDEEDEDDDFEAEEEAIFNWVCLDINGDKKFNINCSSLYSISENLFCFQIGEKFGVVDSNGQIIVPCKYDQIFQYNNNLARVQTGGRWTGKYGFIDMKGHEIVSCKYEDADEFWDDLARVKINNKWGFIDKKGEEVIPPIYSFVKNFSEGLAGVTIDELYGFIDKNNTLKIEHQFDDIEEFKDGLSIVRMGGGFSNDEYVRGKLGLINREGKLISDCKYNRINSFTDNLALVTIGGNEYGLGQTFGFINREGEEIIPCKYDSADNFRNGLTVVLSNEDYFFINLKQEVVLKVKYEYVNNFYDNLAVVSENDKYGYINKAGDLVIGFIYDDALNFNSGFAFIEVNNNWGVIDTNGKEVVKPTFEEIELVPNSKYFIVKTNEKYKLINTSDFIHSEDEFDEIKYSDDGNFMFGKVQELETEIEEKEEGVNQLSKKELYSAIWDIIGGYLFNYSYITWVDSEEAEYIESRGLGCEILEEDGGKSKIKIKIENYIDANFNKDLIDNFNIDKLKGNKLYKATEIENWIDKCLSNLCDLFSSFTVLGGEELHPEDGDTAWDNENTIYLQVPYKEFKLTDLNESWNESQYFLSNEKLSSFVDELNN